MMPAGTQEQVDSWGKIGGFGSGGEANSYNPSLTIV